MSALRPVSTQHAALSSTPVVFASDVNVRQVRVYSNVNFHVAIGDGAAVTDMPVAAGYHGVVIHLEAGEDLSAIKTTGAADGDVWFTVVKRY